MENSELREKIKKIRDSDINQQEKNKKIFDLMNKSKTGLKKKENIICNHYERNCVIIAPCCNKEFPCRLCHDENSDHKINRFDIKEIVCKKCDQRQNVSNKCINCEIMFAKYYCDICHLWLNNDNNPIYHCQDCGICRKGKKEDFFHCKKCNLCLSIDLKNEHKCISDTANSNCPCCNNYLFNSTENLSVLKCGHTIHKKCLEQYIQYNFSCPLCKKSIADFTEHWKQIDNFMETIQMPEEYKDKISKILCNDCEKKTEAPFHFMYHKCVECGGYNTSVI